MSSKNPQKKMFDCMIWRHTLPGGKNVKVLTIEQPGRKIGLECDKCFGLCCRGSIRPVLNKTELALQKFAFDLTPLPTEFKEQMPSVDFVATVKVSDQGCLYYDAKMMRCRLWPDCPASCLAYDCREDERPQMALFARQRQREKEKANG